MQIGNFAAGRAPSLSPAILLQHVSAELDRYRGWYFGLVTNTVPNPFLLAFQAADRRRVPVRALESRAAFAGSRVVRVSGDSAVWAPS